MIFYAGLTSVIDKIKENLAEDGAFQFRSVEHPESLQDFKDAQLFLIGPDETHPVKLVQKIASKDKHLSIVVLANKSRYQQVTQALRFSPFVGKNATCLAFNADTDYASVLKLAGSRTNQRRSFSKFSFTPPPTLSTISSSGVKLEMFGHALEYAPIGVLLLDRAGKVIGANNRSKQMFSSLEGNQVGLDKLFPAKCVGDILKLIRAGKEETMQTEDMQGYYYEISSSGYSDGNQTLLLINDITERREKDKRLEAILESLPQMAWTATPQGRVNYYTQGWYTYTNQTREHALDEGWTSVVHPDDVKVTLSRWMESVKTNKVYQHAARFRRFDGEYRWHLSRAVPVYATKQNILMWVGTSTDIHDQILLAENLEKKVKERTRSLEAANTELEQFAYVSSHDLQEPLRKIQTFSELVKDNSYEGMDDLSKKYMDKIITTATRMSKLLKDLLNFTKLHHHEATTRVDLNEIIGGIGEDLELPIAHNGAIIKVDGLPTVEGHASQLKQLFYNLINNALKFRKPDVCPVVQIHSHLIVPDTIPEDWSLSRDRPYWHIVVKDNGIGFEQKYADQIFTIFQRLHGRATYEGTGIGLAICRKVVSNHDGYIYAVSSPGNGAAFNIVLPAG